jgi:hypothetical protein
MKIKGLAQRVNRLLGGRQHYAAAIAILGLGLTVIFGVVAVQKGPGKTLGSVVGWILVSYGVLLFILSVVVSLRGPMFTPREQKFAGEAAERIRRELEAGLQKVKKAKQTNQLWPYLHPPYFREWEAEKYVIKSLAPQRTFEQIESAYDHLKQLNRSASLVRFRRLVKADDVLDIPDSAIQEIEAGLTALSILQSPSA